MSDRVRVALRVPVVSVERYEDALLERYCQCRPYAGVELERELRAFLDMGRLATLERRVDALVAAAGRRPTAGEKKKNPLAAPVERGETKHITYRIDPAVREQFMLECQQADASPGRVLGRIMEAYAEGGVVSRVNTKLDRVVEDAESVLQEIAANHDAGPSVVERRTIAICNEVSVPFTIEDFKTAVTDVTSLSTSKHVIEKYLPRVLDRKNGITHPENSALFISYSEHEKVEGPPELADPANKPYLLMDEEDLREAFAVAVLRRALTGLTAKGKLTETEAADLINGNPRRDTVRNALKTIVEDAPTDWPVFSFNNRGEESALRATLTDPPDDNEFERLLRIAETTFEEQTLS